MSGSKMKKSAKCCLAFLGYYLVFFLSMIYFDYCMERDTASLLESYQAIKADPRLIHAIDSFISSQTTNIRWFAHLCYTSILIIAFPAIIYFNNAIKKENSRDCCS